MNIAHPWHDVNQGKEFPRIITAYIELTPFDSVKYELDKESGLLKIDRPQKFSNLCPALYGFIPKTYCGDEIGKHCSVKSKIEDIVGDGDPLDICILSEKPISVNNILIDCMPIGGLRMIDNKQADDKIIAVLKDDFVYGSITSIRHLPKAILDRLLHYFKTYKLSPDNANQAVEIADVYDENEAKIVIQKSIEDYQTLMK